MAIRLTAFRRALGRGGRGQARAFMTSSPALAEGIKTALYDFHVANKGKMVPFAGYQLPVLYEGEDGGVLKEHLHTRSSGGASIFDVSHMGQLRWSGKDSVSFLEKMIVGDVQNLGASRARLSMITNEEGNILDDTIVTNFGDHIFMVVNGACKHSDMAHFDKYLAKFDGDVSYEYLDDRSLLALQGAKAEEVLSRHCDADLSGLDFMQGTKTTVCGVDDCTVIRCGYTGEDGFEIGMPNEHATTVADALFNEPETLLAGLGCRDSLRLEAGLCLYGNDLDETTSPVEGTLLWTISKERRKNGGFLGAEKIQAQIVNGVSRKRVGISGMKAPARQGAKIMSADGTEEIGTITSGTFSPCLKKPVAMGYINVPHHKSGTDIMIDKGRGKLQEAKVTKMPFVPSNYKR